MSSEAGTVELLLREVPEAFRGPGFEVVRNNVYELITDKHGILKKHLVSQLQAATRVRVPAEQAGRLMHGLALGTSTLATVGGVCSVATLGVAVVGFAALGKGLYSIGKRLESVQTGVDQIARDTATLVDTVELLDIKVDHLLLLSREQSAALRQVNYQMHLRDFSEIAQAAEVLEVRSAEAQSTRRDTAISQAADRLQVHRLRLSQWLADCPDGAGDVAVELAQGATLLAIAEGRARLLVGDGAFAERALASASTAIRQAAERATEVATRRWSLTSLLSCHVQGLDVPDLVARTVAWATDTPVDAVAAQHLRRAVAEAEAAQNVSRGLLRGGLLTRPLLEASVPQLVAMIQQSSPMGLWAGIAGRADLYRQGMPIAVLSTVLQEIRALRANVAEAVAGFGESTSPASAIAGFDVYGQCGRRLETSLLGVRVGGLIGWEDDRVKALTGGADPAGVLRPSFQVELLQMAA